MAARKIVSQTNDATVQFKLLHKEIAPLLETDKTFKDKDGIEREAKAGTPDPEYVADIDVIELGHIDDRIYHSVHGDYTAAMLKPTEENDYVIEKKLDGNFTFTVLKYNNVIRNKYEQDKTYLDYLGMPAFDPEKHTTDLRWGHLFVKEGADPEPMKEQAAAFEAKWIQEDNEKIAKLEADRKAAEDELAADEKHQAAAAAAKDAEHKTETEGE